MGETQRNILINCLFCSLELIKSLRMSLLTKFSNVF